MNPAHLYLDDQDLIRHPYVSPIFADHFDNMPPILIQSGGCESLRDEICDLVDKIQKSKGNMVHHEIYEVMLLWNDVMIGSTFSWAKQTLFQQ